MADAQDKINALWNAAAATYDETPRHGIADPREEAAWKEALRSLLPPPPLDVLDVGCGTGFLSLLLAGLGYCVRGVDLAEEMLARARDAARARGLDVTFEIGDAIDPPGSDASVDAIVNRHLFWTLTDPSRALDRWRAMLRPGGRLLIIDGLWGRTGPDPRLGDLEKALPVVHMKSLDEVCDLVRAAGFADVETGPLSEIEHVELELHGPSEDEPRYALTAVRE
jgi:ubiquinone/menaquinone biosynthesis C-methylase UbiE